MSHNKSNNADSSTASSSVNGSDETDGGSTPNARMAPSHSSSKKLSELYPVNTLWEITLDDAEVLIGRVYCTDEFSQSVVLQKPLTHTTLASEVRIISSGSIQNALRKEEDDTTSNVAAIPLSKPLPKIHRKTLEERERKALRQAEESFRHINQKASPRGQACFDRLLKACNEVVWREESILVLNQVQVDPPYTPETCAIIPSPKQSQPPPSSSSSWRNSNSVSPAQHQLNQKKALENDSLERVRKIVAAVVITEESSTTS